MSSYLNTNGGRAYDNDFSTNATSQTTNHIYLHPGPNQGEFDNWMQQIGSLLQMASEHAALKPAMELITATFEPQRMFLINHPALPELDVAACTEILVVMDEKRITSKKLTKSMLQMACFHQKDVFVNFETTLISKEALRTATRIIVHFARKKIWCFQAVRIDFQSHQRK